MMIVIRRSITAPLQRVVRPAKKIADVNLTDEDLTHASSDDMANRVTTTANMTSSSAISATECASSMEDTANVARAVHEGLPSVTEGVAIIGEAGEAFNNITASIQTITNQVEDISATS